MYHSKVDPMIFQSTSSMRRMTCRTPRSASPHSIFQSTSSMRRMTSIIAKRRTFFNISIHILHAEDDVIWLTEYYQGLRFQSTSSMRRMTAGGPHKGGGLNISIHILHAEDDMRIRKTEYAIKRFQSTSSMRRMTAKTAKIILIKNNLLTIFTKNNLPHY